MRIFVEVASRAGQDFQVELLEPDLEKNSSSDHQVMSSISGGRLNIAKLAVEQLRSYAKS